MAKTKAQEWAENQVASNLSATATPLDFLGKVLALADDPKSKAAKQFLADIAAAHREAAKAVTAELARLKDEHEDKLAVLSQRHAESLAADRKAFQSECAKREAELKARERKVAERESTVEARERAAEALKEDYTRRTARVMAAASELP